MQALYAEAPKRTTLRTDYPIPATKAKGVRVKVKVSEVSARLEAVLAGTGTPYNFLLFTDKSY